MDSTIKHVAMGLFLRKGYEATNIREICSNAGVEPPTVYYYFGSKKGLFLSVYRDIQQKLNDYFQNTVQLSQNETPEQQLYCGFECILRFTCDFVEDTRFLLRYTLFPPPELEEELLGCTAEAELPRALYFRSALAKCFNRTDSGCLSPAQAEERLNLFISRCQYDIVFLNQRPDISEIQNMWKTFSLCNPDTY